MSLEPVGAGRRLHRVTALALAACLLPPLVACYTYAPVDVAAIQPGFDVRARISASAGDRIAPLLGTTNARLLSGTLITNARDTLIVEVPTVTVADGSAVQTLHQRVSIPRADLLELETRTLDRFRTGALLGGAVVIAGAVLIKSFIAESGKETPPGGNGTDALVPLFRIHW